MTWVAWRQQRYVVSAVALLAAVLAGWALKNGHQMHSLLRQYDGAPCNNGNGYAGRYQSYCGGLVHQLWSAQAAKGLIVGFAVAVPLVLGTALGVGAIAGELDAKTVRLAWTQSVSRTRWLMNKVLFSLASILVVLVPLSFVLAWWVRASKVAPRIAPTAYMASGWMIVIVGVFSFAVSLFVGLLVRRPGWAAGGAILLLLVTSFYVSTDLRPHLVPLSSAGVSTATVTKSTTTVTFQQGGAPKDAWVLFQGFIPVHSNSLPSSFAETLRRNNAFNRCQMVGSNSAAANREDYCLKKLGLKNVSLYVADDQFWSLQLREGAIYLALAALLLALSVYGVRRINI